MHIMENLTGWLGGIAAVIASFGSVIAAIRARKLQSDGSEQNNKLDYMVSKVQDFDKRLSRVEENQNSHMTWHMERMRR